MSIVFGDQRSVQLGNLLLSLYTKIGVCILGVQITQSLLLFVTDQNQLVGEKSLFHPRLHPYH